MTREKVLASRAQVVADRLLAALGPACHRAMVAGSLRRGEAVVKDVEIVAEPRVDHDLFGEPTGQCRLGRLIGEMVADGRLRWRTETHPSIPDVKAARRVWSLVALPEGIAVDLFAVRPPACYGCGLTYGTWTGPGVPTMREDVRGPAEAPRGGALLQGVRGADSMGSAGSWEEAPERGVRDLREPGARRVSDPGDLFGAVREGVAGAAGQAAKVPDRPDADDAVDGSRSDEGRLPQGLRAGSSERGVEGDGGRASVGDGAAPRPMAGIVGMGAPPQRAQERQPSRELGDRDARASGRDGGVPGLQASLRSPLTMEETPCPRCGAVGRWSSGSQWGAIVAIRTGPHDYSRTLVTVCQQRGLRCQDGRLIDRAGRTVPTPSEEDFLLACGVPWAEPGDRR